MLRTLTFVALLLGSTGLSAQITPYQRTAPVKINTIGVYPKLSNAKNWDGREPGTYSLRFKIRGLKPGDTAYIADYYLDNKYLRDTAVVDKKGLINFTGDKKLQRGMYLFVMPKKADFFEFIVDDDQDFTIGTDTQYWKREYYKTMKVEGSDQNTAFAAYQNGRVDLGIEIGKLDESIKKETNETVKKDLETQQKALYEKKENYDKDFIAAHPDHLLSRFLYAMMDVDVPEVLPTKPDGTKDSAFPYNYYKAHYWDHVDLGEDGLVRMPVNFMKQKLNFYFDKLVSPDPDSCIKECNMILDKVKNTIDIEHFVIYHLTYKYETSKIMGQDAVFVNLAVNNYCNGKAWWTDSTTIEKMCEAAIRKSSTLVGRIAPPLELLNPDSIWVNTAAVKAPYTLMIFWDPTCGHCKEVMPKLAKVYEKNKEKGWKVIALASSDKKTEWLQYIAEHPELKEFIHLRRGIVRSEEMAHNMQSFYIVANPTIFVLDKDKKILANRIDSEKIEDFIGHFEKVEAEKATPKK